MIHLIKFNLSGQRHGGVLFLWAFSVTKSAHQSAACYNQLATPFVTHPPSVEDLGHLSSEGVVILNGLPGSKLTLGSIQHLSISSKERILKGIVSDSNNIFLWHESEDINKKSLFSKFQLIPMSRFQVMHNYVRFIAPIDYCVE